MTGELTANYEVVWLSGAKREAKDILKKPMQFAFCIEQAKLLRFFPTRYGQWEEGFFNLDIRKMKAEHYWELRVWDKILEHRNIRIMFAPFSHPKHLVILCVYQKQSMQTPLHVLTRCRHRIRKLRERGYVP